MHKLGQKSLRTTKEHLDIATSHASREYAMGAILDHHKHKVKLDKELDGGFGGRLNKRKKKHSRHHNNMLVGVAVQKRRSPNISRRRKTTSC